MANSLLHSSLHAYVRWRPPLADETTTSTNEQSLGPQTNCYSISLSPSQLDSKPGRTWNSAESFKQVFEPSSTNSDVYSTVVAPTLSSILTGKTCNFLAYGHSGSGKTHTILGYEYNDEVQLGLCLAAARDLFQNLNPSSSSEEDKVNDIPHLGIAVSLYEVRGKHAYDLLNNGTECHIREGPDGRVHVRGNTETLENGKVRVRPIVARLCWEFSDLRKAILQGLAGRQTGSSSVHDESSRTHCILELEIVNQELVDARAALIERESELVPVGKRATDVYLEAHMESLIKTPEGKYIPNPEKPLDQARIDAAEAEKKQFEDRVHEAEKTVSECFKKSRSRSLGGKAVFVDLAGAEYFDDAKTPTGLVQTAKERSQGRQINTDLYALKEVIRARALGQSRIPFRSSPLTMVLKSYFVAEEGQSAMILTVSPADNQYSATLNTLKYGDLVGSAGRTGGV